MLLKSTQTVLPKTSHYNFFVHFKLEKKRSLKFVDFAIFIEFYIFVLLRFQVMVIGMWCLLEIILLGALLLYATVSLVEVL